VFVGVEQNVSDEDDGQYMAALVDADVIEHKEGLTNGRINIAPIVLGRGATAGRAEYASAEPDDRAPTFTSRALCRRLNGC
jgi:hypothetical protein